MSKLITSLCVIFLFSVVFAESLPSVIKNCEKSIQQISMLISQEYDEKRLNIHDTKVRMQAYEMYEAGMDALEQISLDIRKMKTMIVTPMRLSIGNLGTVDIKCSRNIGDRLYAYVKGVLEGLEKLV